MTHRICPSPMPIGAILQNRFDFTRCSECGIVLPPPPEGWCIVRWCDPCHVKREADYLARQSAQTLNPKTPWEIRWDEGEAPICPLVYRDTDLNHVTFNRKAWAIAEKWKYGRQGLILLGDSRRCKSRILFQLLKREYLFKKRSVRVIYGANLRDLAKNALREGNEAEMAERLAYPAILALDDPFLAGAADERVTTFLLSVVDARVREGKPILLSTQLAGTDLKESANRFGNLTVSDVQRLEAIFNRLRDVCQVVDCDL